MKNDEQALANGPYRRHSFNDVECKADHRIERVLSYRELVEGEKKEE